MLMILLFEKNYEKCIMKTIFKHMFFSFAIITIITFLKIAADAVKNIFVMLTPLALFGVDTVNMFF